MKKVISFFAFVTLMLIKCLQGYSQNAYDSVIWSYLSQYGEDTLDLTNNPKAITIGHAEMDACRNNILFDGKDSLPPLLDMIKFSDLGLLRAAALNLGDQKKRHLLAVRVSYGCNPIRHRLRLLYQPLYLELKDTGKVGKSQVCYRLFESKAVYKYTSNGFVRARSSGIYKRVYKRHIEFKHPGATVFSSYVEAGDSTGSVRAVIFPFQEIDAEAIYNQADKIIFCDAAENIKIGSSQEYKQVLLIGCEGVQLRDKSADFHQKFGNLAHLCPPNCDDQKYDLKK